MATAAECNAVLDSQGTGKKAQVIKSIAQSPSSTKSLYYALGGVDYRGKAKWVEVTTADSAATQATAVQAALA